MTQFLASTSRMDRPLPLFILTSMLLSLFVRTLATTTGALGLITMHSWVSMLLYRTIRAENMPRTLWSPLALNSGLVGIRPLKILSIGITTMLHNGELPTQSWGEALGSLVYVISFNLSAAAPSTTGFESWSSASHLQFPRLGLSGLRICSEEQLWCTRLPHGEV